MKVDELKPKDIPVVRNLPSVFPEDVSGLPSSLEVKFRTDLVPRAILVAKSIHHYDCEIRYNPCKVNVVADSLSRKEWMKPRRVRALSMTIHFSIKARILEAQNKASKDKWEKNTMDFITKLPRTNSRHDAIWVIVDRQTKFAHFLAVREDYQMERSARLYINEIRARHGNWDTYLPLVEFSYNYSYHSSMKCAPFEALYRRKCQPPIAWAKVGENKLIGPEILLETTDKIVQIKERLKTARDRQKSYADNR
nr:retrotransposon protein, putative, Ty3-gypsy subclass [Tanacetum cinerariifolium]